MKTALLVVGGWFALGLCTLALWSLVARTISGRRLSLEPGARRRRRVMSSQVALLAFAIIASAIASRSSDWDPGALVAVLAVLALASDEMPVPLGRYRFSGAFLAIVLAAALAGPAPAVLIGLLCAAVDGVRSRPPLHFLLNNLAAYAAFPAAAALALQAVSPSHAAVLALLALVIAVVANLFNFVLIAGHARLLFGEPLWQAVRTTWIPVLPWELATAAVAGATVYGYLVVGPMVVAGVAIGLALLQILAIRIATAVEGPYAIRTR